MDSECNGNTNQHKLKHHWKAFDREFNLSGLYFEKELNDMNVKETNENEFIQNYSTNEKECIEF